MHAVKAIIPLTLALLLPACGGGGGGGGGTETPVQSNPDLAQNAYKSVPLVDESLTAAACDETIPTPTQVQIGEGYSPQQWHLLEDTIQFTYNGINIKPVWQAGNSGQNIVVSVVDDGVELNHEDLAVNVLSNRSRNIIDNGRSANDPSPVSISDDHGTAVAGLIAAAANGKGVLGVAPDAKLVAHNLIAAKGSSDLQDAAAMLHANDAVSIVNNSWGNPDGYGELFQDTGSLWRASVINGASKARCGRGIVYLTAAGNGGLYGVDRSTYDYLNNHPMVLNIGALDSSGDRATYSELGANILVSAPGGGTWRWYEKTISTTSPLNTGNLGSSKLYRDDFSGTSAATPIVSGVVATMLRANPRLSWRDVRWILADTATRTGYSTNYEYGDSPMGNKRFDHGYGFGIVNASAAVQAARTFTSLPAMKSCTASSSPNLSIPNDESINSDSITLSGCSISTVEFVEVTVNLPDLENAGDARIELLSPQNTTSILATKHDCSNGSNSMMAMRDCSVRYNDFTMGSVRHLGEALGSGTWQLRIADQQKKNMPNSMNIVTQAPSTLRNWSIKVWGH